MPKLLHVQNVQLVNIKEVQENLLAILVVQELILQKEQQNVPIVQLELIQELELVVAQSVQLENINQAQVKVLVYLVIVVVKLVIISVENVQHAILVMV